VADLETPLLAGGERLRDPDVELRRGPPDKFHPYSLSEARDRLQPQLSEVSTRLREIPADRRGERVVVEVTLVPNYLAGSYFPRDLLAEADLVVIGARAGRAEYRTRTGEPEPDALTRTLQVAATDESLAHLAEVADVRNPNRRQARVQEEFIRLAAVNLPAEERLVDAPDVPDTDPMEWEAVLHPAVDRFGRVIEPERRRVLELWTALVSRFGGTVDVEYERVAGGLTFVPVTLDRRSAGRALEFNPLRLMQPMPELVMEPPRSIDDEAQTPDLLDAPRESARGDLAIAVFDLGVDDEHPYLNGYVTNQAVTDEVPTADGMSHGTLTASAALYGPLLPGVDLPSPLCPVHHFRVHPPPAATGPRAAYWVLDQIEAVLRTGRYRIASLGMGINREPTQHFINRWTWTLDEVAREHDVLVLVAAGNEGTADPRPNDGSDRVRVPADGVNLLSVGASIGDASQWQRAQYSCRGPGRQGSRTQPMVMAFGGDQSLPFWGAAPNNEIGGDFGTSFSAPLAARACAELAAEIGPVPSLAATLRAFAVHFAVEHPSHDADAHGFGFLPEHLTGFLDCGDDSITVLYRDKLERGQAIAYPLPVPPRDLTGRWRIRWTISFLSPVDATNALDYTSAGIEAYFRPNSARINMNPPPGTRLAIQPVDLRHARDQYEELLDEGWSPSGAPATRSAPRLRTEQELREEGKWETVIHQRDSLLGKSLYQPRLWLNYLAREEGALISADVAPDLDVVLLVTVDGPSGSGLYREVVQTKPFQVLTPLTTQITVAV
jgi:hypothetical protein